MAKPDSKRLAVVVEAEATMLLPRNCRACAHSFMEPDEPLCCGHPDAGSVGTYINVATEDKGHCGPKRTKFEQHPLRNPDGSLM